MNASVDGESLVVHHDVNVGIAVDLNFAGLIAPVIRNADGKRLRLIAREISDLADRARNKQLSPDEIAGGTFTITNPGPWGTFITLPIINQPQVAILSTDGIRKRPWVVTDADGNDSIAIRHVGVLALAWDHRAFDGCVRGVVPPVAEGRHRDARLGGRARVMPLRARWLGTRPLPRSRRAPARAARAHVRRLPAAARAPARLHARPQRRPRARAGAAGVGRRRARALRPRRRRHVPRARPARRLPDRHPARVARRDRRRRRLRPRPRGGAHRRARRPRRRRAPGRAATRASGSATRRSPPSASGWRVGAPATGSRSTSTPTSRCSTTSSRAASPTRASRVSPACSGRRSRCAPSSTRCPPGSPSTFGYDAVDRQDVAWREHRPRRPSPPRSSPDAAARPSPSGCSGASPRPG